MAKDTMTADTVTAAQALIGAGLEAALEARRKAWFGGLDQALTAMAGRVEGFDPERLVEDEAFISTVAVTTRIALETHGAEKLAALRSVVLNSAAGVAIDELSRATFLGFLDRLSDLHVRLLRALGSPLTSPEIAALEGGGVGLPMEWVVRTAFLPFAPSFAIQAAIKGLETEGLVQPLPRLQASNLTKAGPTGACLMPQGGQFMAFVSSPVGVH